MLPITFEIADLMANRDVAPDDKFIDFLLFCVDRLNRDEPVQAIWSAWKESTEKK